MRRVVPLLVLAAGLAGCSSAHRPPASAAPGGSGAAGSVEIAVSVSACGTGWTSPRPGPQQFVLHNTDTRAGAADLVDPASGAVYAEVEPLGPGTTTTLTADLGSGRYAFRCVMEDEDAVTGPVVTLPGQVRGDTPAVLPVSQGDLIGATKAYQDYVDRSLPTLLAACRRLVADLAAGDLAAARRDWLPAHLDYLRLGAAYSSFADFDAAIDGRADGLPRGVRDPSWAGLHRLEFGLWQGQPAAVLLPVARALATAVTDLRRAFPSRQIDPLDIAIRAHEITEDALRFALTGRDDYGSHSAVATVRADVDATRTVLGLVRPLLVPRYPGYPDLLAWLDRTQRDVDATRLGGGYPALTAVAPAVRERIDADVSQLAELLAPVASILEPRRTS